MIKLQDQITTLLREITASDGPLDPREESRIVKTAATRLAAIEDPDEADMIDAIFGAIDASTRRASRTPELIVVDDPDDWHQVMNFLDDSESYLSRLAQNLNNFKGASSIKDIQRGGEGSYYDPKTKTYRRRSERPRTKARLEEVKISDGTAHDDIPYGVAATENPDGKKRTRPDSLTR
jgi:hypothetical protein